MSGTQASYIIGMVHDGSPSLHTALEESSDEDGAASSIGGSSGSSIPRGRNVVTPTDPITTTPALKNTLTLQTIPTVMVRTTVPQLGMEFLSINSKLTRTNIKHEPAPSRSMPSCGQLHHDKLASEQVALDPQLTELHRRNTTLGME
jgi:hypothetical protein